MKFANWFRFLSKICESDCLPLIYYKNLCNQLHKILNFTAIFYNLKRKKSLPSVLPQKYEIKLISLCAKTFNFNNLTNCWWKMWQIESENSTNENVSVVVINIILLIIENFPTLLIYKKLL